MQWSGFWIPLRERCSGVAALAKLGLFREQRANEARRVA
jgi:hypothetical protein